MGMGKEEEGGRRDGLTRTAGGGRCDNIRVEVDRSIDAKNLTAPSGTDSG